MAKIKKEEKETGTWNMETKKIRKKERKRESRENKGKEAKGRR